MSDKEFSSLNLDFVENLYSDYLKAPDSVPPDWQAYFEEISNGDAHDLAEPSPKPRFGPSFQAQSVFNPAAPATELDSEQLEAEKAQASSLQDRVDQLIRAYRIRGHMIAQIDPLGLPRATPPELDPTYHGLGPEHMDRQFSCDTIHKGGSLTLSQILEKLRNTYCRSIGVEYMHIDEVSVRRWLQERMEPSENRLAIGRKEQLRILTRLTDAVTFEEFIRKKFIGAKSFSLEGSESLIPLLDLAIERAGDQGIEEIDLGMAHRGRLNVLANIMGKSPREIFREFADADPQLYMGKGDVKYHKGYSNDWKTSAGKTVHLSLTFNPSHLEFVNPVVLGRMRAKQDRFNDADRSRGMTFLIHGDAAFAGQGVVQETLNLSQLGAYGIGGTLHIIVNNQIGFTTGPTESRSSTYSTDVAKMLPIPIFHVNGEDPEAVAQVVQLAMDFRQTFKRDVVIDMYGYRRLGHNETDEPTFTQPLLYKAIEKRKPVREGYLDHLLKLNGITQEEADKIARERQERFEKALTEARSKEYKPPARKNARLWSKFVGGFDVVAAETDTGYSRQKLSELLLKQTQMPTDFHLHPKLEKWLTARVAMAKGEQPLDWAAAEALAFASLAVDGVHVRLAGQDTGRGTFSHRHAVLHDYEDGHRYIPLQNLSPKQGAVDIINSPLSEIGVLGYEYGYSLEYPDALVLWEAQFGDFVNVAQVIYDQFICSAEDKWDRLSGLVMLLPHGFEGQGPEHSSARLERFLQTAAHDNVQVVYPTTPAQYFHLLRRQVIRPWRKPLVVMSPKSLLRHPDVTSTLEEFATGRFQRVLTDTGVDMANVSRVLLCSGKVYYDLKNRRKSLDRNDVAIIRLEQLYPLRPEMIEAALKPVRDGTPVYWVQEEPENMGAWRHMLVNFSERLFGRFPFKGVYREQSASPATGSNASHKLEQEQLLNEAFKNE
ncbi:MAG TPA: 2-oxoglutarate dehydrogenase E1 component [Methylomirabilota bacterium]|nr:2-oxoglutarate dehydrogenase E1 component [Methylomirabilota bacterium]